MPLVQGAIFGAFAAAIGLVLWAGLTAPKPFPSTAVETEPSAAAAPTATPFVRGDLPIVLGPEGLGIVSFGSDGAAVVDRLTAAFGLPNEDETYPCPEKPGDVRAIRWADLTIFVFDGAFAGYIDGLHYPPYDGRALDLTTSEAVGIGSSRADLVAAFGDRVTFKASTDPGMQDADVYRIDDGRLQGVVEGVGDAGVTITIRAGLGCFS